MLAVLLISGAASLQVYFRQQHQIAQLRTSIQDRQKAIEDLDHRIGQWDDPAYVKQQARERYGWVVPGETGYRVIGPDGKPVEGATLDTRRSDQETPEADAWWLKLWSGAHTADRPLPGGAPVGTPSPTPTPTPTPARSAAAGGTSTSAVPSASASPTP
ncbi:Septum formation initiator [Raineyella antarctica]|uniref:Septum formation initiator n=1 Tax=Raineyella antarctica TaxID=1577474 RepID=A0A1G6GD47_9ACTN|nr:septum formation initiator family protein [Raineyella antarctica]SDB79917.1 Septum formation initiator [Raineyella antarctica]